MIDRGEVLIDFYAHNELGINTFSDHRIEHKVIFRGNRENTSTIDYIITNRRIKP